MTKSGAHCHKLIAETAINMTHELYGATMQNNVLFSRWKKRHPGLSPKGLERVFVNRYWAQSIEMARATLAHMLTLPAYEGLKDEISEALILDASLIKGRKDKVVQL